MHIFEEHFPCCVCLSSEHLLDVLIKDLNLELPNFKQSVADTSLQMYVTIYLQD